jgi:hypothetical protein
MPPPMRRPQVGVSDSPTASTMQSQMSSKPSARSKMVRFPCDDCASVMLSPHCRSLGRSCAPIVPAS